MCHVKQQSPEAILLTELISRRLARIQRDHVHTYITSDLPLGVREYFETQVEDLGQKFRHILKSGCTITKIASQFSDRYTTEVVYALHEQGDDYLTIVKFSYIDDAPTEITKLEPDELPAWAVLTFKAKVLK